MPDLFPSTDHIGARAPANAMAHVHEQGVLATAEEAKRFMLAGNATVTLKSLKTGTHFTFKISERKEGDGTLFVGVLTGPDNETDYRYLGYIRRGVLFVGRTMRKPNDVLPTAPSAKAFRWTYEQLAKGKMPPDLRVYHEGRCGRCGRKLTNPVSIATGIGPECAGRMEGA